MNSKDFMLCESINEEEALKLNNKKYLANYKYDGVRIIAIVDKGQVLLLNRRGIFKNRQFEEIVDELKQLPDCILDGEIISKDNNFNKLQSRAGTQDGGKLTLKAQSTPIDYQIFDLLKADGEMLINEPLKTRVEHLNTLFVGRIFNNLKICEYGEIKELLDNAKARTMEGIIVKDMEARYEGRRSHAWLKLKLWKEATITITTYTVNNAGIRAETADGIAVQIAGGQSLEVKQKLDAGEEVSIYIQYLEKTKENKFRFISYRGMVENIN
jgi:bifunctional non-homologous end joining protein LigD